MVALMMDGMTKSCLHCGGDFSVDTSTPCWWSKKFCDAACRAARQSAKRCRTAKAAKSVNFCRIKKCEQCDEPFVVTFERRGQRFCPKPKTCAYDVQRGKTPSKNAALNAGVKGTYRMPEETKKKIGESRQSSTSSTKRARKKKKSFESEKSSGVTKRSSSEWRAKLSDATKKAWAEGKFSDVDFSVPQERRDRISETVKQRWQEGAYEKWDQSYRTPEHYARHARYMKEHGRKPPSSAGRAVSEETREKLSAARLREYKEGRRTPTGYHGDTHSFYTKGDLLIKMRSKSEVLFAHHLDEIGARWKYEPQRFDLGWCTYTPDFYLDDFDHWVEVKGFWREDALRKAGDFSLLHPLSVVMASTLLKGSPPETVSELIANFSFASQQRTFAEIVSRRGKRR